MHISTCQYMYVCMCNNAGIVVILLQSQLNLSVSACRLPTFGGQCVRRQRSC